MTTNLLNPACDTCYDCCTPCPNYYDPNVWYARFCRVTPRFEGYANRQAPASTVFRYWGPNTIAADISSLLVSWQFDGSQPIVSSIYESPDIAIPSMEQTVEYHTGAGIDLVTENPVRNILFTNWTARIMLRDVCGKWISMMQLSCDIFEGALQFYSPKNAWGFPMFFGGYVSVFEGPLLRDCNAEYSSGDGGSMDLRVTSSMSSEVLPSPVNPTSGNYPEILYRTQANNAMLTCGGYGG